MSKGLFSRWYRYDINGIKYIKRFGIDEIPNPIIEVGYTEWNRGTGPHDETSLNNIRLGIQKACLGVPKSQETKYKMSIAKLGKPKTPEHRESMRKSHQRRKQTNAALTD